jgi:PAS domain S-box-containing protein
MDSEISPTVSEFIQLKDQPEPLQRPPALLLEADGEKRLHELLHALPAAVYTTDALGRITFYNEAAAALWGCRPKLNSDEWCGSWRMFWPDGTAMPHDQCPMATAIKEQRAIKGMEAVAERPDGTLVPFMAFPSPLFDASGEFIGAVNMLVDITERKRAEELAQYLAAIVGTSDDAILSKDLDGVIRSWNAGAERIFGYAADEVIGRPITILIPADRQHEEDKILDHLRHGERIEHYETVRRRKDGTLIDISLSVSPIKDAHGKVIGASKIARNIADRKQAEAREKQYQNELLTELADMRRLQEISMRLLEEQNVDALHDGIVDAAVALLRSDMGTMQLFDPMRGKLRLLAARGFAPEFVKAFEWVGPETGTSCAAALSAGRRVVITNIDTSDFIVSGSSTDKALRECGIRAAQSTPLVSRSGAVLGMITNHWRAPHEPKERELLLMDLLARQAADLIERKQNEEKIALLAREAEHRAKNILAAVQAAVHLTQSQTAQGFKEAIEGRIQALANAHTLFAQSQWQGADLESLVRQELAPYRKDGEKRAHIHGPHVVLEPSTAQAVAAGLHELATNAAKYGALSTSDGHLEICWSNGGGRMSLRWIESAGLHVQPPTREGFGTRMLKALIRGQLNGDLHFDWRPEGLACEMTIPLAEGKEQTEAHSFLS